MLLPVAEAEVLVEPFRRVGDWSSPHGIPAHMTIAGPWPLSVSLPIEALSNLASAIRGAGYTLSTVGTLGDAICLFPPDDAGVLRWEADILDAVGAPDEVDEQWRIHLTVCRGANRATIEKVEQAIGRALPLNCEVGGLLVAQMLSDSQVSVRPL
ncbi:MAG: 2'-5' RNA ligase family protein [Solirubrobacteraceae bacterium]